MRLFLLVIFLFLSSLSFQANALTKLETQVRLLESYAVKINALQVNLDNGKYIIAVDLKWSFKKNVNASDYTDSNLIVNDVKNFLSTYPDKKDFWEVINHKLALFLINKYTSLASIKTKLIIPASPLDPYPHASTVKAMRKN